MLRSHGIAFCLIVGIWSSHLVAAQPHANETDSWVPMEGDGRLEMIPINETRRRKLGSFQICAVCTCCGGSRGVCLPSPCCYSINCNIPNRPFGFCAFIPKTCNCFGCHL
ncbi:hypothetical protein MLD38_027445 [Melastoma candidum]|uniref:Uncharacterized protein n=1 Tax=Melastoma candidum TaxID=119954 RepID=A0ACB9P514_9MYRT|nr:hypothetical protein MLD38_027445 [Melastoma candidum]